MVECYHYDDEDLATTMRYIRKVRSDENGALLDMLNESIKEAVSCASSVVTADDVLKLFEAIDRRKITDPFDAASHMFAILVNIDLNCFFENFFSFFDEKNDSKHCR